MTRRILDLERAERAVQELLTALGAPVHEDPELRETGVRVAEAWGRELLGGYDADPAEILSESTAATTKGLVILRDIATATMCPHHLLPAQGVVHLGYYPGSRVVGLGALGRLVDCYARRLSLQENLGQSIADALVEHLGARAAGCAVDLAPACVTARGGRRHGARAISLAWSGTATEDAQLRNEFLASVAVAGAAT